MSGNLTALRWADQTTDPLLLRVPLVLSTLRRLLTVGVPNSGQSDFQILVTETTENCIGQRPSAQRFAQVIDLHHLWQFAIRPAAMVCAPSRTSGIEWGASFTQP
jgi:hypothetical protein